ncbi:hypothetical protein [Yoonia sp.]|uniref:hypothetical protein n=1 Tax=Yoonia sp. TaxID=2212373 RepID=UPI003974CDBE
MAQVAFAYFRNTGRATEPLRPTPPALRRAGRKARLSGVITGDPMADLLAALPEALGRRLRFHELTAAEQSFDELWLANIFDAIRQGDEDRYRFGMLSRMSREKAASLHFLICKAVARLDEAGEEI